MISRNKLLPMTLSLSILLVIAVWTQRMEVWQNRAQWDKDMIRPFNIQTNATDGVVATDVKKATSTDANKVGLTTTKRVNSTDDNKVESTNTKRDDSTPSNENVQSIDSSMLYEGNTHDEAKALSNINTDLFNVTLPQIRFENNVITIHDKCEGSTTSSIIHDTLGPNEYIVFVDGPELHAYVPEWSNECLYSTNVSVSTNGKYEIKIYKTRTQFDAIDETMPPHWPELHYDIIYLQEHTLSSSASSATDTYIWKASKSNFWSKLHSPGNTRNVTTRIMLDDVVPPQRMINYGVAGVNVEPSLKDKAVLFSGDSNMRTAMLDMLKELKMVNETYDIPFHVDHCVGKWCFQSNTMGTCLKKTKMYDFIVWNFGQHPASGQSWMTFSKYKKLVDSAVKCATSFKENLLWMESPPVPLRNDKWVHSFKDWRSFHRLKAFNLYATHAFENIGVKIIPHWKMMLPLADKINDKAHYSIPGIHRYFFPFFKS